jgi:hypothetical protein
MDVQVNAAQQHNLVADDASRETFSYGPWRVSHIKQLPRGNNMNAIA